MIVIKNLNFTLNGQKIIKNLTLSVNDNETLLIYGKIGSGKTTLFRILTGFYTNYQGEILIDNEELRMIKNKELFSFVEQNNDYQLLTLKVIDELKLFNSDTLDTDIIKFFEMDSLLERNPQTLSSSEKRRLLLTGVFSSHSKYLFLDEPTADLDDYFKKKLIQMVEKEERTVIIFTHDHSLIIQNSSTFTLE